MIWFVILCIVLDLWVVCWRTFWAGMVVPAFDWVRKEIFWRTVEKIRLMAGRSTE